jgi:hypothetical protein
MVFSAPTLSRHSKRLTTTLRTLFSKSADAKGRPNPPFHPPCYSGLRLLPQGGLTPTLG